METVGWVVAFWLSVFGLGLSMSLIEAKQQAREAGKRAERYATALRESEQRMLARTAQQLEENLLRSSERRLVAILEDILEYYREVPEPGWKWEKVQLFLQLQEFLRSIEQSDPALLRICWRSPSFDELARLCRHWRYAQFTDAEVNGAIPVVVEDLYDVLVGNIPPHS